MKYEPLHWYRTWGKTASKKVECIVVTEIELWKRMHITDRDIRARISQLFKPEYQDSEYFNKVLEEEGIKRNQCLIRLLNILGGGIEHNTEDELRVPVDAYDDIDGFTRAYKECYKLLNPKGRMRY